MALEEEDGDFLTCISGGADEKDGDLTVSDWPTTTITDTLEESTSLSMSLVGQALSAFLASHFSFLRLYEGVEI